MKSPEGETFPSAGIILDIVPERRLVTTDAFRPGWILAERAFMVSEFSFVPIGDGRTRYVAKAHHWTEAAKSEHEAMGFLDGWGKATDRLWDTLSDGGEESLCGWLKDKYGVSWQITPSRMVELTNSDNQKAAERARQAMYTMKKIDIAALEAAFEA